jgi:hypothetical protein
MATAPIRAKHFRATEHRFYFAASLVAALTVLVGFSRTYYLKELFHAPPLLPIIHLHAVVFSSWIALFITQTWLVSSHRTRLHMKLGIAGFLLAVTMIIVGLVAAVTVARLGHVRPGGPPPLYFLVVPVFDMLVFATLVAAGFLLRRRSEYHKRLLLVATASLMTAAFGRIVVLVLGHANVRIAFGMTVTLIVAAAAIDAARNRYLHPAYIWSGALVILSVPLRLAIASTDTWMSFAGWLTSL